MMTIVNPEHTHRLVPDEKPPPKPPTDRSWASSGRTASAKAGRKPRYTDDIILDAIEHGDNTADKLLATLNLKSKTTLMTRLRRMRDAGLIRLDDSRPRREGYTISSLYTRR